MDGGAPQVLVALEASGLGAAIRQSIWIYPAAIVGHVVTIVMFAGAVAIMDSILLGNLPGDAPIPAPVRTVAALSLTLWLTIAALGRYIAYD
jgi:hypothetical protein